MPVTIFSLIAWSRRPMKGDLSRLNSMAYLTMSRFSVFTLTIADIHKQNYKI